MKQAKEIKFFTQFSDREMKFEEVDSKPSETFIPGQSVKLHELVDRFCRGQRLNVHYNQPNEFYRTAQECDHHSESFEDCPPSDIYDIVDVERYSEELSARKKALKERVSERKSKLKKPEESKQAPLEAPQDE